MTVNITKKTVTVFIIGLLIGAIITAAGFLIFAKNSNHRFEQGMPQSISQQGNFDLPGQNGQQESDQNGNLKEIPGNNNNQNGTMQGNQNGNQQQPPQLPSNNGSGNTNQAPSQLPDTANNS